MSFHTRNLAAALLPALLATTLLAACSGGGSGPTAPPDPHAAGQVVSTSAGSLTVVSYGCGDSLDVRRMAGEVYTTAAIAARQNPATFDGAVLLDGFEIHARTPSDSSNRCDGNPACFERVGNRGRLHVWCDGGGLEHETAHALGWGGHLSCWETVYHSNNFRCERTTDLYGA